MNATVFTPKDTWNNFLLVLLKRNLGHMRNLFRSVFLSERQYDSSHGLNERKKEAEQYRRKECELETMTKSEREGARGKIVRVSEKQRKSERLRR